MDAESCEKWLRDEALKTRSTSYCNKLFACADELARLRRRVADSGSGSV